MNLTSRTLVEWLKPLLERFLSFGVRVTAEEAASNLLEQGHAARKRGLQSTLEAIDFANEQSNGDEAKNEAIALFKKATVEQARMMQQLLDEPTSPEAAERALNHPFSNATPSATSLPPASGPKAIEQEGKGGSATVKRKRGRPRKEDQTANGQ